MARKGQTLVNPVSGERITFRTTAEESNGSSSRSSSRSPGRPCPGSAPPPPAAGGALRGDRGPDAIPGRARARHGGTRRGRRRPPGLPHDFANDSDRAALVRVEIRPALKMEQLFETAVALAEQGRTMLGGIPKPLELALFTREFDQEVQAAFPPLWLQRLVLAPLAWVAQLRGRDLDKTRRASSRTQPVVAVAEGRQC